MKRGPEIKLPKLQLPKFLVDLYHDLDDRHLLPLVLVLIVAIVAVPFAISGSSSSGGSSPGGTGAVASTAAAKPSTVIVAKETPRLRKYANRLGHLHKKDPFQPKFSKQTAEASASASAKEATGEGGGTEGGGESGGGSSGGSEPSSGPVETKTKVTYFSVVVDVRVKPVTDANGKPTEAEPYVRKNLPRLAALPSEETPALTYVGPSRDGRKALMVVSSNVTSLFGDSPCIIGSETCQLLALEPGLPETVVWGQSGRTYSFELIAMHVVASGQVNRAGSGKPKSKQG